MYKFRSSWPKNPQVLLLRDRRLLLRIFKDYTGKRRKGLLSAAAITTKGVFRGGRLKTTKSPEGLLIRGKSIDMTNTSFGTLAKRISAPEKLGGRGE